MSTISLIVETVLKPKSKEEMQNLLEGLLTPSEIEEFTTRIELVKLLKQGMGQHAVAKKLNIGVATVSRGAKEIKEGKFKYV